MMMKKLDEKSRIKSFIRRKECIKKKAQELAILCDIQVCMLSFGPDGNCQTWPENCNEVVGMIESYKKHQQDRRGGSTKKVDSVDREFEKKEKAIDDLLLLREVDLKMEEVNQRIQFLKMMMSASEEWSAGMGVSFRTGQEEEIQMGSDSFCEQRSFGTAQEEEIIEMGSASFCEQSDGMGVSFGTAQEEEMIEMGSANFCEQSDGMGVSFGTAQEEEMIEMGSANFCEQSDGMGVSFGTAQEEMIDVGSASFCEQSDGMGVSFGTAQEEEMIQMGSASFCEQDGLFRGNQLLWPYLDAPIDFY